MTFHPWGFVVFTLLTVALVLLFAGGVCQHDLESRESELKRSSLWN